MFESFKNVLFKTLVLAHFDFNKKTVLKTDTSQYITGGVLSQYDNDDSLCSVTFYNKNILLIEYNYYIYNKKLLIIIKYLKNWKSELKIICDSFKILTNNQTLKHFKTIQKLFFRQYCYFNLISDFNFYIKYYFEKINIKVNTFIKISDCISDNENKKI